MTLDNDKARELFNTARNLPSAEREPFLDKECGEDDALRDEVGTLLSHYLTSANTEDSGDGGGSTIDYEAGDTIGKFKIIGVLGEGGMGIVYLAEQSKPVRRRVALKVIKAGMDTKQVIARFEAERQALAIMNHPGIAQVYEAGATEEGRPYFVLEFVKGLPITEACDEHKLGTEQRLELLAKVCDAVQHAHTKGIIHRDLKPSNILVSIGEDDVLEPKIIDFGVAKATNQQLTDKTLVTQVGRFIGTPAYMSPEQADLKATDIDTRTDVYALGVVTYEVLTGFPPFDPQTLRDAGLEKMREIICIQPPLKPSTQLSSIDDEDATKIADTHRIKITELAGLLRKELEWIPLKALRKRRSERYDSPKSMADDIRRYLNNEALEAGPEKFIYKSRKLFGRHKIGISFLIAFVAILLAFYAVLTDMEVYRSVTSRPSSGELAIARVLIAQVQLERETNELSKQILDLPHNLEKLQEDKIARLVSKLIKDCQSGNLVDQFGLFIKRERHNQLLDPMTPCGFLELFDLDAFNSIPTGLTSRCSRLISEFTEDDWDRALENFSIYFSDVVLYDRDWGGAINGFSLLEKEYALFAPEDNNYDCDHEEICSCKIGYLVGKTYAIYNPSEFMMMGYQVASSVLIRRSRSSDNVVKQRATAFFTFNEYLQVVSLSSNLLLCVVFVLVALYFGFSLNSVKVILCVLAVPVGIVATFKAIPLNSSWLDFVSTPWPLMFLLSLLVIAYLRFALNTRYLRCLYYISLIPITLLVFIAILAGEFRIIYTIAPYAIILAIAFDLTFRTLKRKEIQLEEMEFTKNKKFRKGQLPPGGFSQWS
jgi:serine/threonine protein kinase